MQKTVIIGTGQELYADSAYIGKGVERGLRKYGLKDRIIKRNIKGKKISKWQDTINRKNAKVRAQVKHVFGYMEECLHGMSSRVVGFARNAAFNTLTNLIYNLCRYEKVMRLGINKIHQLIDNQKYITPPKKKKKSKNRPN